MNLLRNFTDYLFSIIRMLKIKINRILLLYFPFLLWIKLKIKFKWRLKKTIQRQLQFANNGHISQLREKTKRILMPQIEISHYQYYQMFILAKALQLRGAEVKILLCGSCLEGCEIKSIKSIKYKDPCIDCRFNYQNIAPMFELGIVQLLDYVSKEEIESLNKIAADVAENYPFQYYYKGIDIIPTVNDSVIRYYYGAVPDNINELKRTRRQHILSSMINIEVAEKIDKEFSPNVILNNMAVYSGAEPYYKYFEKKGNTQLFSVSITPINYHSIILNIMEPYRSPERYYRYIKFRGNNRLTEKEKIILTKLIDSREKGKIKMFSELGYFEPNKKIEGIIHIDKTKKNIFLFPNIYWDLGMSESSQLFSNVIDFVLQTIDILKDRKDIHLYIKTHPGEKYDTASSLKGIEDFISEKYFLKCPENLTLILPELKIKPYDLFPYIDLGLVYNGTLGLEMLLHNIPIVITGKAPYGQLGFAQEPRSLEEYKKILFGEIQPVFPNKDEIELFTYFYLIRTCIPWDLTKRAYADDFKGYTFQSLDDILPGKNKYLDHLCNCILDAQNTVIEGW